MDLQSKIILISGPTASGKSGFAVNLAKKINGEIINADSMQVYKEVKILTARPTTKDQRKIKVSQVGKTRLVYPNPWSIIRKSTFCVRIH